MVDVVKEAERRQLELPFLIGGATTSRQHTAVKIAPAYSNETVHVLDASRVVDVVSSLLDPARRGELDRENRELQERLRAQHAEKQRKPLLALAAARANRVDVPFDDLPAPPFEGTRSVEPALSELVPYIDWQFFFHAWDLKGKFPAIVDKALADRFAEAFAEWLHLRARREWYAPEEQLGGEDLLAERFRGIRPAFGYPACPDHSEKGKLFELLEAKKLGLALTESYA